MKHKKIIDTLMGIYQAQGYITEEKVINCIIEEELEIFELEYVCHQLLSRGVIISDADDVDEDFTDRSRLDYEAIYNEVISVDTTLSPLISYVKNILPPKYREWQNLILQAKEGNSYATQRLFEMYYKVIIRIALSHYHEYQIALADAIQDGSLGFLRAIEKYEFGYHDKFSTYFPWWVRQYILRYAQISSLFRFPVHARLNILSIRKMISDDSCELCPEKGTCRNLVERVSKKLECDYAEAIRYIKHTQPAEDIRPLLAIEHSVFSDKGEQIESDLNRIIMNEFKIELTKTLDTLKPKEKDVLCYRYGMALGRKMTLEEVGNILGVTRERIRQIESKAIKKLKNRLQLRRDII